MAPTEPSSNYSWNARTATSEEVEKRIFYFKVFLPSMGSRAVAKLVLTSGPHCCSNYPEGIFYGVVRVLIF